MKISVDLSMYPLNADYKPSIIQFIKRLRAAEGIRIETNGMSSQVHGEYDEVMKVLTTEIRSVFEGDDKVSIVMKMVNDDLSGEIKF
jgi:uncharacterized protein YqgV (UPF0045/DUF77 family)